MNTMRRGLLLLACTGVIGACASSGPAPVPDVWRAEDFSPPRPGALVLLLPQAPIPGFETGQAQLDAQLGRQLLAAGWRVSTIGRDNHAALWADESRRVGGVFDPATGAPRPEALRAAQQALAHTVCAEAGCALVLQPRLSRRVARLNGHSAQWDGVIKPVPVLTGQTLQYRLSGNAPALSVDLLAWQGDGRPAFRGLGGHELPYVAQLSNSTAAPRPDLFDDPAAMAEAVRLALQPLTGAASPGR